MRYAIRDQALISHISNREYPTRLPILHNEHMIHMIEYSVLFYCKRTIINYFLQKLIDIKVYLRNEFKVLEI